MATGNI